MAGEAARSSEGQTLGSLRSDCSSRLSCRCSSRTCSQQNPRQKPFQWPRLGLAEGAQKAVQHPAPTALHTSAALPDSSRSIPLQHAPIVRAALSVNQLLCGRVSLRPQRTGFVKFRLTQPLPRRQRQQQYELATLGRLPHSTRLSPRPMPE